MAALNILSFMAIFELAIAIPSRDPHVNFNAIFDVKVYEDEGPNNNQNCPCCPFDWSPVCGADDSHSMSFSNQCFLNLAIKCDPKFENYKLLHDKECWVYCEDITVGNGTVIEDSPYPVDANITFKCDYGYDLEGADKAQCLLNGTWSKKVPQCNHILAARCRQFNGFLSPTNDECFVFSQEELNWSAYQGYCSSLGLGLQMAAPRNQDIIWLTKYILDNFGGSQFTWLGAQGDGKNMRFVPSGKIVSNSDPLWWPGQPFSKHPSGNGLASNVTTTWCLQILTSPSWNEDHPDKPFWSAPCSHHKRILCEVL